MEPLGISTESEKTTWEGRLEDYPLENYPDYVPGKPASDRSPRRIQLSG